MTLSDLISSSAGRFPNRPCIRFEGRTISYKQMDEMVTALSGSIASLGVQKQERVAILMHNCPEYIASYFAVIRCGGIAVPLNTFLTSAEISYIIKDSGCKAIIYSDEFSHVAEELRQRRDNAHIISFKDLPSGESVVGDNVHEDEVAVLLYTSGTTGFPKGAMLSHTNLISNASACKSVMNLSHRDRILLFLPLFHSFSFTVCVILPIYSGATIILLRSVRPFSLVMKNIIRHRITFFVAVPTVYNLLTRKKLSLIQRLLMRVLINIRACISGASSLPVNTLLEFEKKFGIPLLEGYGLTEASPVVAVNPLNGVRKHLSVGPAVPGVEARIVGENGDQLPVGQPGELIIRGSNVMKGYFGREEETNVVIRDGWLYTGDIARMDQDGYIFILDRKKDLIIADGMNIYPREVEIFVEQHAQVEECAMVGVPDKKGSEIPVLFIKKMEGSDLTSDDVMNIMKDRIARFKMPRRCVFVDEFPKTATGKIKKQDLKNWEF